MALTRFICLKQGHKYGIDYVNILHNRVRYYLSTLDQFVCYTDTPDLKFDDGITVKNLPTDLGIHGWWYKLWILGQDHPGENLYMDLDMLIVGDLRPYRTTTPHGLWGIWNVHHLNSSILSWRDSLVQPWQRFEQRQHWHLGRGGVWGDQDVINECVAKGDFTQHWYPQELTAWLDVKTPGRLARDWTGQQKTIVCKGPRNPHEHSNHPLVRAFWRKI